MPGKSVFARIAFCVALPSFALGGCAEVDDVEPLPEEIGSEVQESLSASEASGRDIWFNNTYGGEKFFTFLENHPDPVQRIKIGFEAVVNTPRAVRFDTWGVLNDPDCTANPAGGADICPDPNATGVVGMRKFPGPGGTTMFGAACAVCHAGIDPVNPPADPNVLTWDNIHATIGNQHIDFGAVFGANLAPTDVRGLLFASWPQGAVDTTQLFSDNIMNPGVVTAFWGHKDRNRFDVGMAHPQLRNGQGGEDDVGDLAAVRVYTNIGACFFECTLPAVLSGTELDIDTCKATCPDYPPQQDLDDMTAFLRTFDAPQYPGTPNWVLGAIGKYVFNKNCESCHARDGDLRKVLSDDEVVLGIDDPNSTNTCRVRTSNWEAGKIWGQFSSDVYKDRLANGGRGHRNMPLAGIWSTAPFMHNQSIGVYAAGNATPQERAAAYWESMFELLSDDRDPVVHVTPIDLPGIPAGTPLHYIFSRDPATGEVLCTDLVENRGHYFGSDLPTWKKIALTYWLQYQ